MFLRALQKDVYNLKIKKLGVGLIVLFQFAMYKIKFVIWTN